MSKLLASTCVGLGVMFLLGCQPITADPDEEDDLPAVPIAEEDAARVIAEQICANLFACECQVSVTFADEAACVEQQTASIEVELDAVVDGGSWNAECAGQLVKTWSKWDCYGWGTAMHESSYDPRVCPIIKGNKGPGAECWAMNYGDDCREGLSCIDQICIDSPTFPVPLGGVCEYQWENLPCAAGSYCGWNGDSPNRTCVAIPQAGDPCDPNDYLCGSASYDLFCDPGTATCTLAPGAGEPCFDQFLCAAGNYCDGGKDFSCQPRRELGDSCGADTVCPVDASCISNICTADPAAVCNLINWP